MIDMPIFEEPEISAKLGSNIATPKSIRDRVQDAHKSSLDFQKSFKYAILV